MNILPASSNALERPTRGGPRTTLRSSLQQTQAKARFGVSDPSGLNSRVFECRVIHERFVPRRHCFVYRLFMLALDLDELSTIQARSRLLSINSPNLYGFREGDFLPLRDPVHNPSRPRAGATEPGRELPTTLKGRVAAFLRQHGIDATLGRVELITMPRVLGYQFNPISIYFCYAKDGESLAAIAEVTNTFREIKPYLLPPTTWQRGAFRLRVPKHFYVSPYSAVDVAFDFALRPAGKTLAIRIDDFARDERTLATALTGRARPLSDSILAWFLIKYPFLTLRVIAAIHWHALRLFLKRIPWFRKAARPADQRDVYRPHPSLAPVQPHQP